MYMYRYMYVYVCVCVCLGCAVLCCARLGYAILYSTILRIRYTVYDVLSTIITVYARRAQRRVSCTSRCFGT